MRDVCKLEQMKDTTLLIVDDEPAFVESLCIALGGEFNIRTALNGIEAVRIMDSVDVSLVLLDMQMPVMGGVEFLQRIRSANNMTPVLVLTGNSSHDRAKECANLNVQGYMEKPVDIDRLVDRIKKLVGGSGRDFFQSIWGTDYQAKIDSMSPSIRRALDYVSENYQKELTREEIAGCLNITAPHLSRQFSKECGIHLNDYINKFKVCKCKAHLKDLDKKVGDIASMVGISDLNYFCRLFKKHTGLTPQAFRKKQLSL